VLFVDRYRLVERLGRGGMGEVWEAMDEELGRTVALKLLHPHLAREPGNRARFLRETKALAMVEHANLPRLYASDVEPRPYMVIELVRGITLRAVIRSGPVETELAVCYAILVAEGLGAAHRAGLVHRDVKPENVIVGDDSEHVWLLDLGIAHDTARGAAGEVTDRLGTLGYVTPEMVRGEGMDKRSDFFQLGVMLYELLTGHKPWPGLDGATESEVQAAHACEDPDPLAEDVCPAPLWRVLLRLLAKRKEDRHANADEVAADLRSTLRRSAEVVDAAAARMLQRELLRRRMASLVEVRKTEAAAEPQRETVKMATGHVGQSPASPSARASAAVAPRQTVSLLPGYVPSVGAPFPLALPRPEAPAAPTRTAELPAAHVPGARWPFVPARRERDRERLARALGVAFVVGCLVAVVLLIRVGAAERLARSEVAIATSSATASPPAEAGTAAPAVVPAVVSAPAVSAPAAPVPAVATAKPSAAKAARAIKPSSPKQHLPPLPFP
jgi:Protein kinase domain